MKQSYKIIVYFLIIFILVLIAYSCKEIFNPLGDINETSLFTVEKGSGLKKISLDLKNSGYIDNQYMFIFYAYLTNNYNKIQAGEYLLSKGMNMYQMMHMLSTGETAKQKITIIEGWDLRDLADYFEDQGIASKDDFYNLTGIPMQTDNNIGLSNEILNTKPSDLSLEGYMFPDTYYFEKGVGIETIINEAVDNLNTKLSPEIRNEIQAQNKSIFEIMTMASLIEKEVKTMEDKQIVSGILWNRLERHMPLQVDATVLYATGKEGSKVYINDTKFDSRYNTYKYPGLPLGPICNPGLDSIKAAINPIESSNLYYLSAPDGKTYFSKTLEEHNANKARYLK